MGFPVKSEVISLMSEPHQIHRSIRCIPGHLLHQGPRSILFYGEQRLSQRWVLRKTSDSGIETGDPLPGMVRGFVGSRRHSICLLGTDLIEESGLNVPDGLNAALTPLHSQDEFTGLFGNTKHHHGISSGEIPAASHHFVLLSREPVSAELDFGSNALRVSLLAYEPDGNAMALSMVLK